MSVVVNTNTSGGGGSVTSMTATALNALASAGGLTPNSWYVAADSGVRYWASDASALQSDPPPAQASAESGRTILWDYERDGLSQLSVLSASCTIEASTLNGVPCAKITGTSTATAEFQVNISSAPGAIMGGLGIDCAAVRATSTQLTVLMSPNSAFSTGWTTATVNPTASSTTSCWTYNSTQEYSITAYPGGSPTDGGFAYGGTWVGTPPTYPTEVSYLRGRVQNVGGQVPVWYVRRFYAAAPRVSRVVLCIDDGYATAYRLLKPVIEGYKLRASWAIIPTLIDATATYMKRADVHNLFDQGHEIVTHGALSVPASGSVSAFMADAMAERQLIRDWGLATTESDRCYVWPGGAHQAIATDDTTYRDAMRAVGIVVGRTASQFDPYSWTADTWPDRLTLPIIGHTQAASSGLEATNIALMVSRINNAALFGTDVILMLHAGVSSTDTNWGSNGGLNIRTTDLATICAAIRANVVAGTQQCATLGQLV